MTKNKRRFAQPTLIAMAVCMAYSTAWAESERELETVEVTGETSESYLIDDMDTATGLGLSSLETPQSVSAIGRVQMDDFKLYSLNDALQSMPGIQVESVETDRTYYSSRGFDVTNFQVDGVGVPATYGNRDGETDTAIYERIEVVRGANGLMSGAGNPSATVNMVRKRPAEDFALSVGASAGSWNKLRTEADVSGTLTYGLRGRMVVAREDRESYLDFYAMDKTAVYGVVEKDLGAATQLTLGSSYLSSEADSPLWGALPLVYSDGAPTDYDVSASTSAEWAYWDNIEAEVFAELKHQFANGWEAKAYFIHSDIESDSELLYMYSLPDAATDEGLIGYASEYTLDEQRDLFDLRLAGSYRLLGREHDVLFGYNWAKGSVEEVSLYDYTNGFPWIGDFTEWNGQTPVRPVFTDGLTGSDFDDEQSAFFAATRFHVTDAVSLIGGARVVDWEAKGTGYGTSKVTRETGKVLPYAGLVYRIGDNFSVYASHTETFMPQDDIAVDLTFIDPTEGSNSEIGAKGQFFGGKLMATVSYYETEQANVAEYAGQVEDPVNEQILIDFYEGRDYKSQGYDLTLSGQLSDGLQVDFSYASVDIENREGNGLNRDYIPAQTLRLFASYRPPMLQQLKVGGGINWQDDIQRTHSAGHLIEQEAYATLQLFANYRVSEQLSLSLNGKNLTDEKYISSLYWDQGFYAAPRNFSASVNWRY
ncbi:outer-membrane receptor for ferric coprogen and ferric-rhodotorulic acid [Microbulbifer donghaiensis]|uniref:Outer-membrane receptor for ferric coprogen and ferric-rhodotorulic acid n=1 Tax=Microbulbifer donghaiensis TaxID=494016 RepID=A0A1M4Z7T2_9GAMM|nr:TonB-dependent siderophore receptor [Microbulbifer donghaiensis]SHF14133.1 outer-membrane receptor for ferric coprogen and ferric-rhodotorulic acid [Microbulbifer donghaiensis]